MTTTEGIRVNELTLICGRCTEPVEGDDGFIGIWHAQRREAEATEKAGNPVPDVDWSVRHYACTAEDPDIYGITAGEVRTWRALVRWTAHLMDKPWIGLTDWSCLLEDIVKGESERIIVNDGSRS